MEKERLIMKERGSDKNIKVKSWLQFLTASGIIFLIAALSSIVNIRIDLTEDKRFTLSDASVNVLSDLKSDIYAQVYLDGEIPIPLKRMRRSVNELLEEFRIASGRKIDYEFINPSEGRDNNQRQTMYQSLINKGLSPVNIQSGDTEGGSTQKIIFPGMIVNYNGIEVPVNFLKNNPSIPYEQNILHSIEGLEYEMIQTIATVSSDTIYKVAFIEGHGELSEVETADITINLARFFTIDRGTIDGKPGVLDNYSAIIIAGPETEFTEPDKFALDQYIMNGGKVMWLIDAVSVNSDSLAYGETAGLYRTLNIEDQLFRYGARVNAEIVQDLECMIIRLKVSTGTQQQYVPVPWVYYPLLVPSRDHPVTRNLNRIKGEFTGYIDTVGLDGKIRKKVLLTTSDLSRTISPPVLISLKEAEISHDAKEFNRPGLPVAVLLDGVFPSAFRNRLAPDMLTDNSFKVKDESLPTKMIVIADGDIIKNEVQRTGLKETPLTLGLDKYTGQVFGNRDFLINCLNYLVDDNGLMELRSREIKLRLMNKSMIRTERLKWQIINIVSPVLIVVIAGLLFSFLRRRKYTGF